MEHTDNIRQWRGLARDRKVTMRELARLTGKAWRTVYSYSAGQRNPSQAWLDQVGVILGERVR